MSVAWSKRIEQHYSIRLPSDLRAWFDDGAWKRMGGAEFNHPLPPEQLIDPPEGTIWSGFMLPDTLPLIGNQYGDWLCLRVGADGTVSEIVWWSHNGGDWLPFGRTLAEALLYDAACYAACSRQQEHGSPTPPAMDVLYAARWASAWLPPEKRLATTPWFICKSPVEDAREELLAAGLAEVAVRRDRTVACLRNGLRTVASPQMATQLDKVWERDFVRWMFDTSLMNQDETQCLSEHLGTETSQWKHQDWDGAEREAVRVGRIRSDLGWAFDIAGWAAERRGDIPLAIRRYLRGIRTSIFSDDSVTFRTHWFDEGFGKFPAFRLAALRDHLSPGLQQDPYLNIFWKKDAATLRKRLCEYWVGAAGQAERDGRYLDGYNCYYNAGWDCGVVDISCFSLIFEGLCRCAEAANAAPLRQIASMHATFLAM